MPKEIKDAAVKKAVLKAVHVKDGWAAQEPSPDGRLKLVFFGQMDVSQGHGIWRSRFAILDDKNHGVREFGWRVAAENDPCAWSPDSVHAAVALSNGIVFWRKGKFAAVRVLSWGKGAKLAWKDEKTLLVSGYEYVKVRRGGADSGGEKIGKAEIGLEQVEFYHEDRLGTIEYLLNRQPILTPELFED
ncbi:MAG: hypothetical protein M0D55_12835 [Elusimicrobiota bacterium]|nr:MAG: hypothetical protein M0D55_12835 [Elusimicrobiota bacterium]